MADDDEQDGTPVLDEENLEENNIAADEVEDIEWEESDSADAKAGEEKKISQTSIAGMPAICNWHTAPVMPASSNLRL